jgi:tetratricopeptide (TPR) repeat protein/tRNA A-37 threonylcarbamoyl transferase component Bud32
MLKPGSQLAQFKIVEKLGQGGMGAVYLAEDQKLHRRVALKTLSAEMFENAEHQERFVREARTAAQISHGNVMAIFDIDTAVDPVSGRSVQYIVMEYVKGQSLTSQMKSSRIDIASAVRLAEKITGGLAAAHKLRIVHRDIKSDNIIIDEQNEPKILDFGLAKPVDPVQLNEPGGPANTVSQELTRAGKILGTVSYMSPEQIKGEPVDMRSDIFSFGILLYRMTTGESPFEGGTQVSTLAKILETAPEPPRTRNTEIPAELERIIDKCLQKDANDRYQDTRDLVVDLRNLRKSYDSGSTDTVSVMRERAGQKKKSVTLGFSFGWKGMVITIFGMLLLFAIIMELIEGKGPRRSGGVHAGETGIAILGFDNRTGDTSLNWLGTGLPEILITDLAQNQSLRVISRQRLVDHLASNGQKATDEELRAAAVDLGADNLLTGTYFKLGDQVRIDARLEEIGSGKILLAEKVVGADPFKLVDSLSQRVRLAMNLGAPGGSVPSVAQLTSSSPEAYKHYLNGLKKFGAGDYDSAIVDFEQAVAADSAFALAHMRIGMALTFSGKQQKGTAYFETARKLQDRLPVREKSLVDVYANIWLDRRLADASTKLKAMVANYPDDKEVRAVYGIFLGQLNRDTAGAFAQFDSALQLDPTYPFAISLYAQQYAQAQKWGKAIEWSQRLLQTSPSAQSHRRLAVYLSRESRFSEAVAQYEKAIGLEPGNIDNYSSLVALYLRMGDIEKAAQTLPQEKQSAGSDPYKLIDYYDDEANLHAWHGDFHASLRSAHEMVRSAEKTKDSTLIFSAFQTLVSSFNRLDWKDSVMLYYGEADRYANVFQKLSYPMTLVDVDRKNADIARPLLAERLTVFKERLPSAMWPLADALQKIFDAYCTTDSVALIAAYKELIKSQNQPNTGNTFELGTVLVLRGEFVEAKGQLEQLVDGPLRSISGDNFPIIIYYLGMAEEGLGNRQKAVEYYQEMLKYWGGADIQTKEIKDAKARLARLTG